MTINKSETISKIIKELTGSLDIVCYGGKSLVQELSSLLLGEWHSMETAPRDGSPILAYCCHDADPYQLTIEPTIQNLSGSILTPYGANCEGLLHVEDGYHVLVYGGGYSEWDYELGYSYIMPDYWFLNGSNFEIVANPIKWKHIK